MNIEPASRVFLQSPATKWTCVRRPQWQLALLLLVSGIAAFCAGSRATPRRLRAAPRAILATTDPQRLESKIPALPVPAPPSPYRLKWLLKNAPQVSSQAKRGTSFSQIPRKKKIPRAQPPLGMTVPGVFPQPVKSVLLELARLNASLAGSHLPRASLAGAYPQFATGLGVRIYDGTNTMLVDPCKGQAKLYASVNQTANTQLVAGTASKKIYVCSIHVVVAAATNVALVEGTGSVCGTSTAGVSGFGGATAATGWNFAANGGIAFGNGDSSLGSEGTSGDNLCLFNSGSGQVSGGISYVVQ